MMNAPLLLARHRERYPLMEAEDAATLICQAMLGCGHLLRDEATVADCIQREMNDLAPYREEPLTEPIGCDYLRVHLRPAKALGIQPVWSARMMLRSAEQAPRATRQQVAAVLQQVSESWSHPASLCACARRLLDDPDWLPRHSEAYRRAYQPAYRVVASRFAPVLQALAAIARQPASARMLVTIDGPCASGKTTLAALLAQVTGATVIHLDDFYLPHAQKTAERLAIPGGNADVERFQIEVLTPWLQGIPFAHQPYSCHDDRLLPPLTVQPCPITLVEGSYSNLPPLARHASVRLFLSVDPKEQRRRLCARNGEASLPMFLNRWIPLENAYFQHYGLPDSGCVVLCSSAEATDTNCCV